MAKMIDDIRERLLDHVLSLEEIDSVLEENKYLPIETDEDDIDTFLDEYMYNQRLDGIVVLDGYGLNICLMMANILYLKLQ